MVLATARCDRAGGPKIVSRDAAAIIRAALLADPAGEARAALANTLEQITRFASGDGLTAWPDQVSPWIERDFPAREQAAYASARQQTGSLSVPPLLARIHRIVALVGVVGCALLLPVALRRRAACAGFLLAVLLALPVSAAITGSLSAPHDRYQARIMWLPPFIATLSLAVAAPAGGMRRDAFWSGLEAGVSAILSIVTSFVVARVVGPAEFGIGAAAIAVHVVLWVVVNALFADALVQRPAINDRARLQRLLGVDRCRMHRDAAASRRRLGSRRDAGRSTADSDGSGPGRPAAPGRRRGRDPGTADAGAGVSPPRLAHADRPGTGNRCRSLRRLRRSRRLGAGLPAGRHLRLWRPGLADRAGLDTVPLPRLGLGAVPAGVLEAR